MMAGALRIVRLCAMLLLILVGITFALSNREFVSLTFFPFPYSVSVPLFLLMVAVFVIGTLTGWSLRSLRAFRHRLSGRASEQRVQALENELAALRTERAIRSGAMLSVNAPETSSPLRILP